MPLITSKNLIDGKLDFSNVKFISDDDHLEISKRSEVSSGDILYAMIGTIGNPVVVKKDVDFSIKNVGLFKSNPDFILPAYLRYWLGSPSFNYWLTPRLKGTTQKFAPLGLLRALPIPVAPLEQQKRIVAKIEELFSHIDAGIEALNKAKQLLKQYRQSVLKAAVTGELTKDWREQNKGKLEPASKLLERILKERRQKWEAQQLEQFEAKGKNPKNYKWKEKYKEPDKFENLPFEIPVSWSAITLDVLIDNIEAGKSFRCDERPPEKGETGIVKVSAVSWGEFDSNESKTITDKDKINDAYRIDQGDFLFSRANTLELVGACVIVKKTDKDLLLSDKVLRFNLDDVWKKWILIFLRSSYGREEIERLATGNQESMRNIGQAKIRKIRIPIFDLGELHESKTLVNRKINALEIQETEITKLLLKAEKNKQSILASAFSGNLIGI